MSSRATRWRIAVPAMCGPSLKRKTILATTLLLADDLDQAVEVAGQILDEAEQIQSGHVRAEIVGLARQLAQRRSRTCIDLLDRVQELRQRWPAHEAEW